jgi:hypothetical protein
MAKIHKQNPMQFRILLTIIPVLQEVSGFTLPLSSFLHHILSVMFPTTPATEPKQQHIKHATKGVSLHNVDLGRFPFADILYNSQRKKGTLVYNEEYSGTSSRSTNSRPNRPNDFIRRSVL